ncbi:MAG: phosphoribosylformylglycinamidine synthase subunit PurQ [bacterium]
MAALVKSLVLTGHGINCEAEMAAAYRRQGATADIKHLSEVIAGKVDIRDYQVLNFPGGFSFGDDLGSALALANLIRHAIIQGSEKLTFLEVIQKFISQNGIVFGVCNGFQVMVKLGILPGWDNNYHRQEASLAENLSGKYENRWVWHTVNRESPCVATKGIERIFLPVRHGEGRFVLETEHGCHNPEEASRILDRLKKEGNITLWYADPETGNPTMEYPANPNGSLESIAGLCDPTGRVFGQMAHPEAFLLFENHPHWTKIKDNLRRQGKPAPAKGDGQTFFRNIVEYASKNR